MSAKKLSTTPNELGNGNLPSGYDEITFTLSDGNWMKTINLPPNPTDNCIVIIRSQASFKSWLNCEEVNVLLTSLVITRGSEYSFRYKLSDRKWTISGTNISYLKPKTNTVADALPDNAEGILFYSMADGSWSPEIKLPAEAKEGTLVIIRSQAGYRSKVLADNMLYASTTWIVKGDEYCFQYLAKFRGWVVDASPNRILEVSSFKLQMPYPTAPKTLVSFSDSNWIAKIKLPESAGDRDKVSLQSDATSTTEIDPSNVNAPGAMILLKGQRYDFFYIAENRMWELIKAPVTTYRAGDISDCKIPPLTTPKTVIEVDDGNYTSPLALPDDQPPGSRVIINSSAAFTLIIATKGTDYSVHTDEIVVFKVDGNNRWYKETVTIDLLLLYSDKAEARLGEKTMRNRLIEGLNLTNEALENSGANFRYRIRDIKKVTAKDSWKTLNDPVIDLRSDPVVQGWRDALKADRLYYEGTEDGCGLAWVKANDFNMVATGSINSDTITMRHELGHIMGLNHSDDKSSYNRGYSPLKTIMGGNDIPFYSTPRRYTEDHGIPMGIVDKFDAVRAMNEFAAVVSNYR